MMGPTLRAVRTVACWTILSMPISGIASAAGPVHFASWRHRDARILSFPAEEGDDLSAGMRLEVRIRNLRNQAVDRPGDLALRIRLGGLLLQAGRADDAAMEYWGAARRNPGDMDAVDAFATSLLLSGDPENAVRVYRTLLEAKAGDDEIRNKLAAAYYRSGHFDKAAGLLESAATTDPQDAPAHFNLALIQLAQDRGDQAIATLKRLSSIVSPEQFREMLSDPAFEPWAIDPAFQALLQAAGNEPEDPRGADAHPASTDAR